VVAAGLNNLGIALQGVRRFEEAITAYTQAAAIYVEAGDRHGEGMTLNNLGLAQREVRRFEEAITAHTQAAAIYVEDEHPGLTDMMRRTASPGARGSRTSA
jgi:Flp pilus assembly protein TadD